MRASTYSIKDLEKISGIKAHTLRVWEQRYDLLKPKRTDTNIRYYDGVDLRLVLNISMLKCNGYKISQIASMTPEEIRNKVQGICDDCDDFADQINALTLTMIDLDEPRFEKIIASNALKYGFEHTMVKIIYPFFEKVGILWQTGSITPAHEHFISNLIRRKVLVAIDGQKTNYSPSSSKYLLFLPEGEMHELSLLFSDYLLRARNNKVIFLGANVPKGDLSQIYSTYQPDYFLIMFTTRSISGKGVSKYLQSLSKEFPEVTILFSGQAVDPKLLNLPSNAKYLKGIEDLIHIADLGSRSN